MSNPKKADQSDDESCLDEHEQKLLAAKDELENAPATRAGGPTQSIDPATILTIITTVLALIKQWRNR